MDLEIARQNLVDRQLRTWEVLDARTLQLFGTLKREDFVPQEFHHLALADTPIPLPHGEVTMAPKVEARMLQALAPETGDVALEIGTGCGFVTALLASCTNRVHSIDIYPEFTAAAQPRLAHAGLKNVQLHTGNAAAGWNETAPYDIIAVTGSLAFLPHELELQLKPRGRLFVILGVSPVMEATLVTRVGSEHWNREILFETDLPPLRGIPPAPSFRF